MAHFYASLPVEWIFVVVYETIYILYQVSRKKRYLKHGKEQKILDVVQLEEYCNSKSAVPADEHEAFVVFFEITGFHIAIQKSS